MGVRIPLPVREGPDMKPRCNFCFRTMIQLGGANSNYVCVNPQCPGKKKGLCSLGGSGQLVTLSR